MGDPSKTEKATPRKKREARKKGQVAKSVELGVTFTLLFALIMLKIFGRGIIVNLKEYITFSLSNLHTIDVSVESVSSMQWDAVARIMYIVFPFMVVFVFVAFAVNVAQIGFQITPEPLKPDLSKINPISGLKRFFSSKGVEMLIKSLVKISMIGYVSYDVIHKEIPGLFLLVESETESSFLILCGLLYKIGIRIVLVFIVIALADYLWQRHAFDQKLKMTKQEIKDEHKRTEGNPLVKAEIRRRMRGMMRNRMMTSVPKADVVVTNPIHLAIAIEYNALEMDAPQVVAKGARLIADQIKDVARDAGVPIIENRPLAQSLYQAAEVGDEVPEDLFNAVAEVLTYVHNLTGQSFGL